MISTASFIALLLVGSTFAQNIPLQNGGSNSQAQASSNSGSSGTGINPAVGGPNYPTYPGGVIQPYGSTGLGTTGLGANGMLNPYSTGLGAPGLNGLSATGVMNPYTSGFG
uniref:Uncharacterized protein n=1 Tax=Panagrolaimus sp. PS1159 TaxID=55785 RepID=A0AC35GS20_9BILA